jgi:hypothetical protein
VIAGTVVGKTQRKGQPVCMLTVEPRNGDERRALYVRQLAGAPWHAHPALVSIGDSVWTQSRRVIWTRKGCEDLPSEELEHANDWDEP